MTFDEAIASIKARAPIQQMQEAASLRKATAGGKEEFAYLLAKWAKKNGTDEELAAIGMSR